MIPVLLVVCAISLIVGLALLWYGRARWSETGLPPGKIVSSDMAGWRRPEKPLFSNAYRLVGRPDYVIQERGRVIPVEVKSMPHPERPHRAHVLQLLAYCLLVEETENAAPPHGLLHYRNATYRIPYTRAARDQFLKTLARLRVDLDAADVARSHHDPARCRSCGVRAHCSQSL